MSKRGTPTASLFPRSTGCLIVGWYHQLHFAVHREFRPSHIRNRRRDSCIVTEKVCRFKMKIAAAAVASLACLQSTSAFVGPQFASRVTHRTNLQMHKKSDEQPSVPGWISTASTVIAGLTIASQAANAVADPPGFPTSSATTTIETTSGKKMGSSLCSLFLLR